MTRTQTWRNEAACAATATALAHRPGLHEAFIELHGTLGAGKTTFVRYLLQALGVEGRIKSPTYALMESYAAAGVHGGYAIAHFDFYRFDDPAEWEDAGFRDVFAERGLKLVEWPEKAAGLLPTCDLRITIAPRDGDAQIDNDDGGDDIAARDVRFEALTPNGRALLP